MPTMKFSYKNISLSFMSVLVSFESQLQSSVNGPEVLLDAEVYIRDMCSSFTSVLR
jgi:hypothetical protein